MTCLSYDTGYLPKTFRYKGRAEFRKTQQYVKTGPAPIPDTLNPELEGFWEDNNFWDDADRWGIYTP